MFNDGFETVGYNSFSSEREPSRVEKTLSLLKTAVKSEDWRLAINVLEDWPEESESDSSEQSDLRKALDKLHGLLQKRKEQGRVFSSESLGDLATDLEEALARASQK